MHIVLADSIDGGILAILTLGGGLVASLLALGGLVPAAKGNKLLTFFMIVPALIAVASITVMSVYSYFTSDRHDPDFSLGEDFILPWLFLAAAPLLTSSLAAFVL